jgi:hypothetical protein
MEVRAEELVVEGDFDVRGSNARNALPFLASSLVSARNCF